MSTEIKGKGRVFSKEHDGWTSYTLGISSKTQEGKWVNAYQPIRFKKTDTPPANATDINYTAFPVVKERTVEGQNRNYIVWQILNFSVVNEMPTEFAEPANFTALEEADIPF